MNISEEVTACGSMTQFGANQIILPPLLGWALRVYLFGAVTSSGLSYLVAPHSQTTKLGRRLVLSTVALDAAGAFFNLYEIVYWGSLQVRTFDALIAFHWVDLLAPFPAIVIALIVQVFYTLRAAKFITSMKWRRTFVAVMSLLIGGSFLSSLNLAIVSFVYKFVADTPEKIAPWSYNRSVSLSNWFIATTDLSISAAMWISLRSKIVHFNLSTDRLLQRVAFAGLTTASYTSFFAVTAAILSAVFDPDDSPWVNVFLPFWIPLPSLYVLSLLATLNLHRDLRSQPRGGAMTAFAGLQVSGLAPKAGAGGPMPFAGSYESRHTPTTSASGVGFDDQRALSPKVDILRSAAASVTDSPAVAGKTGEHCPA